MKDLYNITKEFLKLSYESCVWNNPILEPTNSYSYLSRQLAKCLMRSDAFNYPIDPVTVKIISLKQITILHVCGLDEI